MKTQQQEQMMGYTVIADKYQMDQMRDNYGPRRGLEGPFCFAGGRVLYYCPKEGAYWDPKTDFFMSNEEMTIINNQLMNILRKP